MIIGNIKQRSIVDFPGYTSAVIYTQGCNFRCPYCHNPELVDREVQIAPDKIKGMDFSHYKKGKADGIIITGGEPCIHEDLPIFMHNLKQKGFAIKLDTNGVNADMLEEIIKKKLVDYIAMDIKAPLDKYSSIVCCDINTNNVKRSIDLIMNSGLDYEFGTTVVKSLLSVDDFEQIGELVEGARLFCIQKFLFTKVLDKSFMFAKPFSDSDMKLAAEILQKHGVQKVKIR